MNKTFLEQHSGTFQFLLLTTLFALPLFFGIYVPLTSQPVLNEILALEIGVLIYGFYLAGFVFVPIVIADGVWVRRICLLVACLFAIPLTSGYRQEFGALGLLGFCFLLFANYSSVFIASISFEERGKLTVEMGLRVIVYIVIFGLVGVLFDMKPWVSRWSGDKALLFGATYFGVLTFIESQRYFSKVINLAFHFFNGTLVKAPKSGIRIKNGKIKAYVLSKNNLQRGPLFLFTGSATTFIAAVFLYGTTKMESLIAMAAIWTVFTPLLILGGVILYVGLVYPLVTWRKGPSLLRVQEQALRDENKLYASGSIPCYSGREKRATFSVHLVHYRVESIEGEEFVVEVKTLFNERLMGKDLQFVTTDRSTEFQVECALPPPIEKKQVPGGAHIWHLQATMHEVVTYKGNEKNRYSWEVAFPLPVPGCIGVDEAYSTLNGELHI